MANVTKEKQVRRPWVLFLIFAAIIAYIITVLVGSLTKKEGALIYEVSKGSISDSLVLSGIILRNEKAYESEGSGNIEYYQTSGSKVKVGDVIYSIDKTGNADEILKNLAGEGEEFSDEEKFQIHSLLSSYRQNYGAVGFDGLYDAKAGMSSIVLSSVRDLISGNKEEIDESSGIPDSLQIFSTDRAGYVVFSSDGYEDLSGDDVSNDLFDKLSGTSSSAVVRKNINAGDPVYKLILSDNWEVYCKLSEDMINENDLTEKDVVYVNLNKAGANVKGNFEVIEKDGEYFGLISLNKYVMNYARDRVAELEISSDEDAGLQIPNSSIVEKDYYKIPAGFLTSGDNSNAEGFMAENGTLARFIEVDPEMKNSEYVYVAPEDIEKGSVLVMPDSEERFTVSETQPIKGVLCVNSGFAVFKAVDVVSENKEYSIINEASSGVSLHERILLDAGGYSEGDVVY